MNLNQLQYFKILAQEEHYTRAAQMLSIMVVVSSCREVSA